MAAALRSRAWTWNCDLGNVNDEIVDARVLVTDETYMERFNEFCPSARYCIFQREVGLNTGNIHLQGFVYFQTKKSSNQLVALHMLGLVPKPYFLVMAQKSSIKANIVYCSKDDDGTNGGRMAGHVVHESGDRPHQGARNDIPDVVQYMVENPTLSWTEIAQAEPRVAGMMRYKTSHTWCNL